MDHFDFSSAETPRLPGGIAFPYVVRFAILAYRTEFVGSYGLMMSAVP